MYISYLLNKRKINIQLHVYLKVETLVRLYIHFLLFHLQFLGVTEPSVFPQFLATYLQRQESITVIAFVASIPVASK